MNIRERIAAAIPPTGARTPDLLAAMPDLKPRQIERSVANEVAEGKLFFVAPSRVYHFYFLTQEDADANRIRLYQEWAAHSARQAAKKAARSKAQSMHRMAMGDSVAVRRAGAKKAKSVVAQEVIGMDTAPRICAPVQHDYRHYVDPNQRVPGGFAEMGIGQYLEVR